MPTDRHARIGAIGRPARRPVPCGSSACFWAPGAGPCTRNVLHQSVQPPLLQLHAKKASHKCLRPFAPMLNRLGSPTISRHIVTVNKCSHRDSCRMAVCLRETIVKAGSRQPVGERSETWRHGLSLQGSLPHEQWLSGIRLGLARNLATRRETFYTISEVNVVPGQISLAFRTRCSQSVVMHTYT